MYSKSTFFRAGLGFGVLAFLFFAFVAIKYFTHKPPATEMKAAREELAKAKNAGAGKYAVTRLNEAERLYDEALKAWSEQNSKSILRRDYSVAKDLATAVFRISNNALREAGSTKDQYIRQLEKELQKTEVQINRFERYYKNLPVGRLNFDRYNKGKMLYLEARHEFTQHNYPKALQLVNKATEKLDQAEKASRLKLHSFYEDYPNWEKHVARAYQQSKRQTVVLVNKMDATCTVVKNEKIVKSFSVELSPNWMDNKRIRGDRATPQGAYRVVEKKKGKHTKYYKALLLDYPNANDKMNFANMKKSGRISGDAHIGGLIEIHGQGGKGIHWTDGCVALRNIDMDSIYDLCHVGTPVFIVGSEKTLEEYLNE